MPEPYSRSRTLFGYVLLVVTAVGWAGAWLTARVAAHDAPPLTVTWSRFVVAALALIPAWLVFEQRFMKTEAASLAGRDSDYDQDLDPRRRVARALGSVAQTM